MTLLSTAQGCAERPWSHPGFPAALSRGSERLGQACLLHCLCALELSAAWDKAVPSGSFSLQVPEQDLCHSFISTLSVLTEVFHILAPILVHTIGSLSAEQDYPVSVVSTAGG